MNIEKKRKINELRNNKILLNNISKIINLINDNSYDKIDAIVINDFIDAYEKVNEDLRKKLTANIEQIVDIFIIARHAINNVTLNNAYNSLEEMVQIINAATKSYNQSPGEIIREKAEQINFRRFLAEQYRNIETQYLEDAIFLSEHLNKNGERVYSDEWLLNNLMTTEGLITIADTAHTIRTHGEYEPDHNIEERRMRF